MDIEFVLLDGVDDVSAGIVLDEEAGDVAPSVEEEVVLERLPEFVPLEVEGVEGLDEVEGVDIVEVSVVGGAGGSVLLQAPSAAKVAASATHLIELRMFTPRKTLDENVSVLARPARKGR